MSKVKKAMEKFLKESKFTKEQKKSIDKEIEKYFKNKKCKICNHTKFYCEETILKIDSLKKPPKGYKYNISLVKVECEFCHNVNLFNVSNKILNNYVLLNENKN